MQKQEQFYQAEVHPIVQNFIKGQQSTILVLGPSASGKNYTVHGGNSHHSRGLLTRICEKIIPTVTPFIGRELDIRTYDRKQSTAIMASDGDFKDDEERCFIRASCYLLAHDTIYDLLHNSGVAKPMH
jgi:hypothetical protein